MDLLKKYILLLVLVLATAGLSPAQKLLWQACIGDLGYDNGMRLIPVEHGCFLMGGSTSSTSGFGEGNHSTDFDLVVALVSGKGQVIWKQVIGGSETEEFGDMKRTPDGGVIIIGTTQSNDGQASGNHGKRDIILAKLDKLGSVEWAKVYGGLGNDKGMAVTPLTEGGYLIGGESGSNTGDMTHHKGGLDAWVAKLAPDGSIEMQKTLGGRGNETVTLLQEIKPGRYMVVCNTTSTNGDVQGNMGAKDVWIACLSKNFDFVWTRCYGGSDFDEAHAILRNHRGEFVIAGTTFSEDNDLDLTENHGLGDSWLFLITDQGNLAWSQAFGGSKSEGANGIAQTPDNGYLLVGTSNSQDRYVPVNKGLYDGWIVRTDSIGRMLWSGTFGGEDFEYLYDAYALEDGNYLALGFAESVKGDLLPMKKDVGNDFWFIRFSDPDDPTDNPVQVFPFLNGKAYSRTTGFPLRADVYLTDNSDLSEVKTAKSDKERGIFDMELPEKGDYSVMITAPGYMFHGENIDYDKLAAMPEMRIDAALDPIMPGSKVALRNIYFDAGKWDLKDGSEPELRRLLKFMQINQNIRIEISGHTDDTGNTETKKELSRRRASTVRDWMLLNGVPGHRMEVAGYGMERPVGDNTTEEGRGKNRRVEVEILEVF